MAYTVEYFNTRVLAEIESWPVGVLADYARTVELLMCFGPEVRMPHSRSMGGGLFELRASGPEGQGRAMYCFAPNGAIVVVHACVKKTRATSRHDLAVARGRMKEVCRG